MLSNNILGFDPPSTNSWASTSSSSIPKIFQYDVFISFSGKDTRKTFVGHLYKALADKGIATFKDDKEMKQGKTIDNQLIQAIRGSRLFIIVFSQHYGSSSWCLDELVEIMECQETRGQTAYPVFFNVEPTHVRKQIGAFGEAFLENKKKDAAQKWIEALKGASNLAGWDLEATFNGYEAELIKTIVGEISLGLRSINLGWDENLVGMKTRVKDVLSSLKVGIDEVQMIGIKGIGGGGKTATARAVYDYLSNYGDFEAVSFVENVREASNCVSGLEELQKQVLSDVLNEHVRVNGVLDGIKKMRKWICGKKVLLVLDDVDHIKQLKALAGERKWFKPGSIILITTRDEQVLITHKVNVIRDIVLLSEQEASCLFSRCVLGRENPLQGYEELSQEFVRYAAGLPFIFEVLGSLLYGKDKDELVDAMDRLKKNPYTEILERLELSYNSLEKDFKEIFLAIACILKGRKKEDAIRILECCGRHARIALKVLQERSLITVCEAGFLGMHDRIEEMAKNIVRRLHPDEPNKHSYLWVDEEIEDILAKDMGTKETRYLKLNMRKGNLRILMKGLGKMNNLIYLEVEFKLRYSDSSQLDESTQYFPNSLRCLICWNYPFLYLPKTFKADNLVGLHMTNSRMVQLWKEEEKQVLKTFKLLFLKHLHISHSKLRTFDLELTPNLETLSFDNCVDLVELHTSVACPNLKFLNLCKSRLRSLNLELFPNLKMIDVEGCYELSNSLGFAYCVFLGIQESLNS